MVSDGKKLLVRAVTAGALAVAGAAVIGTTPAAASTIQLLRPSAFDFTQTYAGGHNVFGASGIHVYTDNDGDAEASGSFDLDKPLADVGEPNFQWIPSMANDTPPGMLMSIDFDGDGTADGYLIGERAYTNGDGKIDWWAPSGDADFVKQGAPSCHGDYVDQATTPKEDVCDGGGGSYFHGLLDDWRTAFPHAKVLTAGYNLGSGVKNDGTLVSLTFAGTTYTFTDQVPDTTVVHKSDLVAALSDTRATGHVIFEKDDLHVYTEGATSTDKAAEYFTVDPAVSLVHAGQPALHWTGSAARPGSQLVIDFDGDGTPDGTLVGEPVYGDDYWLTNGSAQFVKDKAPSCFEIDGTTPQPCTGGSGSDYHGTLADWARTFPDAKIMYGGFSLGSGVLGDGRISAIDIGDTSYTFANVQPVASDKTASTTLTTPVAVDLTATDADSDPLTYTATDGAHGTVAVSGATATYTAAAGFVGTDSFTYTVSDGLSDPVTKTVTVTVAPAASTISYTIVPSSPTVAQTTTVTVTVASAGDATGGGVTVAVGAFHQSVAVSGGKAVVVVPRQAAGKYATKIRFNGSTTAAASDLATTTLTVNKIASTLAVEVQPSVNRALVTVTAPYATPAGGKVTIAGVGSGTVVGSKAAITLPKLAKGKHTWTVTFAGTATAAPATLVYTFTS